MLADLKYAIRSLRSTPTFTIVALAVLTVGIGATTAIFSVVDGVALRGLPFPRSDRLVAVDETPTGKSPIGGGVAAPNFYDWRAQQTTFEGMAAIQGKSGFTLIAGGEPEDLRVTMVSANLFSLLRTAPAIGHLFTAENEVQGNHRVAVISDAFWRRRFGADPNIVGKTMTFDSGVWEILGVMPRDFMFPVGPAKPKDMWIPYVPPPNEYPRSDGNSRNYNAQVVARLKDGVTIEQARRDMEQITQRLKEQYPRWFRDRWVAATPLFESIVGKTRSWMLMLLGAVAFVMLIACVNVANLLLARATTRAREVGVRAALGATRWQLARGLLIESLLISTAGTLCGLGLAVWGVDILRASLPPTLPRLMDVAINLRVLAAAAAAAFATGILFGLLPAWQFSRPNVANALREGGRSGAAGLARQRVRGVLLVAEVALAVVLLIGSGLFVSSFVHLMSVDLGLDYRNVVTVQVYPRINYGDRTREEADRARAAAILADVVNRLRRLPGVETMATVSGATLLTQGFSRNVVTIPGKGQLRDPDDVADNKTISPDYFKTIGVPVLAGRAFEESDSIKGAAGVVILNDVAAKRYFGDTSPLGTIIQVNSTDLTVVGIVRAVRLMGPEGQLRPEIYMPFMANEPRQATGASILLRTTRDPALLIPEIRAAVRAAAPDLVLPDPQTLESSLDRLVVQRRFNMLVLALFGILAIVIAAAGIYGVMAYIVEQRTQEIGVRMALGARGAQVLRMILNRALLFTTIGLLIGVGAGWMLSRLVQAFLFHVDAHDPIVYAGAAAILLLAAVIAAFVPARRASKVDPLTALR